MEAYIGARLSPQQTRYASDNPELMAVVTTAASLAMQLHHGQTDKAGCDYFEGHLTAVALKGSDWKEMTVGFLHDAAEDTSSTTREIIDVLRKNLAATGIFSPAAHDWLDIEDALNCLNSHTAPNREAYIGRLEGNHLACVVKAHDLEHNMLISRIPNPTTKDFERLARYKAEYRRVVSFLTGGSDK